MNVVILNIVNNLPLYFEFKEFSSSKVINIMDVEGIYQVQVYYQTLLTEEGNAIGIKTVRGYILHPEINGYYRIYKISEDRDIPFLLVRRVCFETQLEYSIGTGVVVEVVSYSNSSGVRPPNVREKLGYLFTNTDKEKLHFEEEEINTFDLYYLVRRKFRTGMNLPETGSTSELISCLYSEVKREIPDFIIETDSESDRVKFRELCLDLLKFS